MKVNFKVTKKVSHDKLGVYLDFTEMKEEFMIIALCSVMGYLQQSKVDAKMKDDLIYVNNELAVNLLLEQQRISISVSLDKLGVKINGMLAFVGIQTYLKIYFNLYENNEYYKIEEFHKKIGTLS
jgi:hypothetical protein